MSNSAKHNKNSAHKMNPQDSFLLHQSKTTNKQGNDDAHHSTRFTTAPPFLHSYRTGSDISNSLAPGIKQSPQLNAHHHAINDASRTSPYPATRHNSLFSSGDNASDTTSMGAALTSPLYQRSASIGAESSPFVPFASPSSLGQLVGYNGGAFCGGVGSVQSDPSPMAMMRQRSALGASLLTKSDKTSSGGHNMLAASAFCGSLFSIPSFQPSAGGEITQASKLYDPKRASDCSDLLGTLEYLGLKDEEKSETEENNSDSEDVSVLLSGVCDWSKRPSITHTNDTMSPLEGNIGESVPSRSIWVGNVDSSLSEQDLLGVFCRFGNVESIRLLKDKECAFINYRNILHAIEACRLMQNGRVGNCIVKIGFGKIDSPSGSMSPTEAQSPSRAIWIGNLSANVKPSVLLAIFEKYGDIDSSRVLPNKNCGFVNFTSVQDAIRAKHEVNGFIIDGMPLHIGFAKAPVDRSTDEDIVAMLGSSVSTPTINNRFQAHIESISSPSRPETATPQSFASISQADIEEKSVLDSCRFVFYTEIPPLRHIAAFEGTIPPGKSFHRIDPGRLRDIKRKLDHSHLSPKEFDTIFQELFTQIVELATDGFGNTVVQKLIERASDQQRLKIIEKCEPQLAGIGVHKNGTWVVQKMLECAKTTTQTQMLLSFLKPYIAALLMDPFGNYVVQGCLKLGGLRDQFVFDAMYIKCLEIAQGKFGARAMRACLESQHATKKQQKQIAVAVVKHSLFLITNPNGILLIHWLVDNSDLTGRYRVLVPRLLSNAPFLCNQKLSHVVILKIITQTLEPEARDQLVHEGIFRDLESLKHTMLGGYQQQGHSLLAQSPESNGNGTAAAEYGVSIVLRCIQTEHNRARMLEMCAMVRIVIEHHFQQGSAPTRGQFFKRLLDEVSEGHHNHQHHG